jgi:hypothetical protein
MAMRGMSGWSLRNRVVVEDLQTSLRFAQLLGKDRDVGLQRRKHWTGKACDAAAKEITEIADQADGMHRIHTGLYEDDKFLR